MIFSKHTVSVLDGQRAARVALSALLVSLVWLLVCCASQARAQLGCDVSWVGPAAGGSWSTPTGWSSGAVPAASDVVCLPAGVSVSVSTTTAVARQVQAAGASLVVAGTLTLSDAGGVSVLGSLSLSGTLSQPGELRVVASASLGGTLIGGGSLVMESTATGQITGGTLNHFTLRNDGSLMQGGTATMYGLNGAVIDNRGSYTLNVSSCSGCSATGLVWSPATGLEPKFLNTGTLLQTAGASGATLSWGFDNDGVVDLRGGLLTFARAASGSSSSGSWSTVLGASATLNGAFTLASATQMSGVYTIGASGQVSISDLAAPSASLSVAGGGVLQIGGAGMSSEVNALTNSGSLTGGGELRVRSALTNTGTMAGSGSVVLESTGSGTVNGGTLDGFTLRNDGNLVSSTSNRLYGKNGATIDNRGTYTLNIVGCYGCSAMGLIWEPNGDLQPQLRNAAGAILRRTATGTATVSFGVDNDGTVDLQSGSLTFTRGAAGSESTGTWAAAAGATSTFTGAITLGAGSELAGALSVGSPGVLAVGDLAGPTANLTVALGATLQLGTAGAVAEVDALTLAGTLSGSGELRVRHGLTSTGTLSGSGSLVLEAAGSGTANSGTLDGFTLRNDGAMSSSTSNRLLAKNGATIDNRGEYTLNGGPCSGCSVNGLVWIPANDQQPKFINRAGATLRRTAAGSADLSYGFENDGAVILQAGTVAFRRGATGSVSTGSWSASTGASATLGGTFSLGSASEISGAATIASGGQVTVNDLAGSDATLTVATGGILELASGAVANVKAFTTSGTLRGSGLLRVLTTATLGGTMTGTGALSNALGSSGTIVDGTIDGFTLRNHGTLTFGGWGRFIGKNAARIENYGVFNLNAEGCSGCYQAGLIADANGPAPLFANRSGALLRKNAGTGTSYDYWPTGNAGQIITSLSGVLRIVYPLVPLTPGATPDPEELRGGGSATSPGLTSCGRVDPVDCTTGDFYENLTDLSVAGRGRPLVAQRSYSAQRAQQDATAGNDSTLARLGAGWMHPYATRLELPAGYAIVHGANGASTTFYESSNGTFTAAARVKATLARGSNSSYVLTYKDQTKDVFDSSGRLLRQLDRAGYATSISYDASGRIDHVTNEAGRQLNYTYDANGRIATITDPLNREVAYHYSASGDLIDVVDTAGETSHYTHDAKHRIVTMTDPLDHQTTNTYDDSGRVLTQTDAAGAFTRFAYGTASVTVTDPRGHKTRYEQTNGLITKVIHGLDTPQETTVSTVRDASGNATQRTDPDGQITTVTYDSAGNATKVTDPLGRETTMTYAPDNDLQTVTDAESVTTTMTYDSVGNLTSVARPLTGTSSTATTTFGYDPSRPGDRTSTTDPNGKVWSYAYDADGNRVSATDPEGNTTTAAFDAIGSTTSTVSPRGNATAADPEDYRTLLDYDDHGLPVAITDPTGATTTMTYDAVGNQISVVKPGANTTTTTYDELNRPTLVTRDDGSTLRFGYDANGNRTSLKDGLNHETTFTYDPLNREISTTDPANRTTSYTYDASSRQKTITDAMARTTTLSYDVGSQLQQIDYSDAQTASVDFDYDSLGRRTAMTHGSGTSSYTYDSLGRLKTRTDGSNRTIAYAYDLANRLTKTTYPAALVDDTLPAGTSISEPAVTRGYDDAGRVISITDWLAHETQFAYDANDNLREQRYPNATTATFDYDNADRLTGRTDSGPGSSEILDLGYTRKLNGQLQTQNRTGQSPAQTDTLTYDDLDQLTGATLAANTDAYAYAHDIADRLTQITTPDSGTTLEYDAANQLVRTRDAATNQELTTFSYDSVGNRTAQDPAGAVGPTAYDYDQAGRLTHYQAPAADPGDPDVERNYAYDGDGLRSDLLWDTSTDLPLIVGDSAGLYISGPDGLPLTQLTFDGKQRYYHHDQLGSTRAITDSTGTISARYSFDSYGNTTDSSGSTNNPFGYAGQYTDRASGLIYMRARWYDPATGQFITSDPIGSASGETHLYRYAGGDPANMVDPSGLLFGIGLNDALHFVQDTAGALSTVASGCVVVAAILVNPGVAAACALASTTLATAATVASTVLIFTDGCPVGNAVRNAAGAIAGGYGYGFIRSGRQLASHGSRALGGGVASTVIGAAGVAVGSARSAAGVGLTAVGGGIGLVPGNPDASSSPLALAK